MGIAAVDILSVISHVAHVVVGIIDSRYIEFFDEIAVKVVFVEHRQHCRRLAPSTSVDVLTVVDHAVLATCGARERVHEIPHVAWGLSLDGTWHCKSQSQEKE